MATFFQDIRYSARMLLKSPGFTLVAVLTLALGIGANTAIFSLVNGVLLRSLPYPEPGRLVRVFTVLPTQPHFPMAVADFYDYRERTSVFAASALYAERDLDLTIRDRPEHLSGLGVTHEYFTVLGCHPALGRDFDAKDEYKHASPVVILSDRLWRTHFHADSNIVGKTLLLSGESFTVIGVMESGVQHVGGDFHSPSEGDTVDLWWPLALLPHDAGGCDRGCHYLNMVARLKPGMTVPQASAVMNSVAQQLSRQYPDYEPTLHVLLVPLKEEVVGKARLVLLVLMGAVGFLLLIACANVANLMLSRATARTREIAIRSVLGAGAWRIIRQLLSESLFLAFIGCAFGIILAIGGVAALVALSPDKLPRLQDVHVDARVLLFALVSAICTAVLFGLAPALAIVRSDVNQSLKDGDRGATFAGTRGLLRNWLVVAEMALALVLLAGAGLLIRTFVNLQHVDMGFQPDHALIFQTDLPQKRYPNDASFIRFYKALATSLQALPEAQAVGFGSDIPWTGYDENSSFDIEGRPSDQNHQLEARYHYASPGYFEAAGIPLLSGRAFAVTDDTKSPKVVIVNSVFARRFFSPENAVGKRLDLWGFKGVQVVGVIGDVKDAPDALDAKPAFYWDEFQFAGRDNPCFGIIRAGGNLSPLVSAVRQKVAEIDKDLPVTNAVPMDEVSAHAVSTAKFTWMLVSVFAALAMLLAGIGIFGVMSYSVNQRRHEFGIRMALGAQSENVLAMVLRHGACLAAAGVFLGLLGALVLARTMRGLLYGVNASDPWTFIAVSAVLVIVALAACYIPARRAARVDPLVALRYE